MNKEQQQTLETLQAAIQMEKDGKKYYQQLSKTGNNESGRKLFAALALEENQHILNFETIYHDIEVKAEWPEVKVGPSLVGTSTGPFSQPVTGHTKSIASELKSVQKAMEMENKTLDYYLTWAATTSYPIEKRFCEALAEQERTHHSLLLEYFEFLKDPAQWFTMKEHQSMDGG